MQFSAVLFMMHFNKNTFVSVKNPKEVIAKMFHVIVELQHLSIRAFLYSFYPKCYTLTIVSNNFIKVGFIFHFLSGCCQGTFLLVLSYHCFNPI